MYTYIYSSVIHNNQKVEAGQVLTDKWMNKQNVAYTNNGLLCKPLKRNEILTHATTWMKLEDIKPGEIHQSRKDKYYMILLIWGSWNSQIH